MLPGLGPLHRKSPFPQLQHSEHWSEQPPLSDPDNQSRANLGGFQAMWAFPPSETGRVLIHLGWPCMGSCLPRSFSF